jgi:hypothetical protein
VTESSVPRAGEPAGEHDVGGDEQRHVDQERRVGQPSGAALPRRVGLIHVWMVGDG